MGIRPVLILEGADGAGKTTLAQKFLAEYGGRYTHLGPLPRVTKSLARMYIEAMMPALQGFSTVILDRSWLSEVPYGKAFRGGKDRMSEVQRRMVERVAMRAGAIVISCDPGWEAIERSFIERKGKEMLKNLEQLKVVHEEYQLGRTALDTVPYNYTTDSWLMMNAKILDHDAKDGSIHDQSCRSAGNWRAPILIVGEKFSEVKDHDPLYQHPFVSFDKASSSHWLTAQLEEAGLWEDRFLWVNGDEPLLHNLFDDRRDTLEYVFTLGKSAETAVKLAGNKCQFPPHMQIIAHQHPQYWKRFKHGHDYPLIEDLASLTPKKHWSDK